MVEASGDANIAKCAQHQNLVPIKPTIVGQHPGRREKMYKCISRISTSSRCNTIERVDHLMLGLIRTLPSNKTHLVGQNKPRSKERKEYP